MNSVFGFAAIGVMLVGAVMEFCELAGFTDDLKDFGPPQYAGIAILAVGAVAAVLRWMFPKD